jgi:hypothetical protein
MSDTTPQSERIPTPKDIWEARRAKDEAEKKDQ